MLQLLQKRLLLPLLLLLLLRLIGGKHLLQLEVYLPLLLQWKMLQHQRR